MLASPAAAEIRAVRDGGDKAHRLDVNTLRIDNATRRPAWITLRTGVDDLRARDAVTWVLEAHNRPGRQWFIQVHGGNVTKVPSFACPRLRSRFSPARDFARIVIPRRCLGGPKAIRVESGAHNGGSGGGRISDSTGTQASFFSRWVLRGLGAGSPPPGGGGGGP